jgi:hypothetical protein
MENEQPISTPTPTFTPVAAAAPNVLAGKIPSTVAFIVGVLLFFMPFIDIKCNNMSLQQVSGLQLATGFKMKNNSSENSFLNDVKTDKVDETITKTTTNTDKKDPNLFAMVALGLGVLGLILSLTNAKTAIGGAMITGIASAGSLIGMMFDIKKKIKLDIPDTGSKTGDDITKGIENIGKEVTDKMNITVDFTAWYYIAVIAFLAAAFLCYKRMTANKG